jgi:acyl carrier protein
VTTFTILDGTAAVGPASAPSPKQHDRGGAMQQLETLEADLKRLIVEVLVLEDVRPEDIDSEMPLFNEGLGLDSIDSLDLAMALEDVYGLHAGEDVDANRRHFLSVRSLASFVAARRTK